MPAMSPPPTASGIRARNRAALEAEIRTVARRHLAAHGAAALSLRAVARDLDLVPSALYRYLSSRDDLLTLLIVDAYDELGDAVDAALEGVEGVGSRAAARERFLTIATTLRGWALANPAEYALLYGSPVPDYQAPPERTTEAGTRVLVRVLELAGTTPAPAEIAGTRPDTQRAGAAALERLAADPEVSRHGVSPDGLQRALAAWNLVMGAVSSELFEQLGPGVSAEPDAVFAAQADLAAALLFDAAG